MKIQFIGTGNIGSTSNSASILINEHILFDMPNGNLKAMIRQNIDLLKKSENQLLRKKDV